MSFIADQFHMSTLENIDFVPIRLADAATMAAMSRDLVEQGMDDWNWTHKRILKNLKHPDVAGVKARDSEQLAGFAIMQFAENTAHLNLLAVYPVYQRLGIGRALLEWHEETARVAGITRIDLEVRENNMAARRFYRRLGFQEKSLLRGYYSNGESAVTLLKIL